MSLQGGGGKKDVKFPYLKYLLTREVFLCVCGGGRGQVIISFYLLK